VERVIRAMRSKSILSSPFGRPIKSDISLILLLAERLPKTTLYVIGTSCTKSEKLSLSKLSKLQSAVIRVPLDKRRSVFC